MRRGRLWSPRLLDAATACCVLAQLLLLLWPIREQTVANAGRPPSLSAPAIVYGGDARAGTDSTALDIVSGNVFSSSRRAPTTRFRPPGSEGPPDARLMAAYDVGQSTPPFMAAGSDAGAPGTSRDDPVPRLYGIVTVDGVRRALLALRAGDAPRLFDIGERYAGYRVTSIDGERVILATASGSRTLRQTRPASRDSSENTP